MASQAVTLAVVKKLQVCTALDHHRTEVESHCAVVKYSVPTFMIARCWIYVHLEMKKVLGCTHAGVQLILQLPLDLPSPPCDLLHFAFI